MHNFKLVPPNYFIICLILNVTSFFVFPKLNLIRFPWNLIGIIFIACGFVLIAWTNNLMKKMNTPHDFDKSTCCITNGPFKFTRNPMYLSMILILLGIALCFGNIISMITPLLFFLIIHFIFIPYEEKKMQDTFGNEYLEYKQRVRRWI